MAIYLDPDLEKRIAAIAEETGQSPEVVLRLAVERGLPEADGAKEASQAPNTRLVTFLEEMQALPIESPDDGFSGTDHDKLLYGGME